jgi:putative ubiquitin-RnfH superfamily antitoxin RatB of RatAB toxin-antitoxin module
LLETWHFYLVWAWPEIKKVQRNSIFPRRWNLQKVCGKLACFECGESMETSQFKDIEKWFEAYVAGAYGDDEFVNANLKLKEEHSKRTADEMEYLATSIKLDGACVILATAIGLLHDVGRFEQFMAYRTYNDAKSTNHGRLGIKVLRDHMVLAQIDQSEMSVIETAVEYHGVREIPAGIAGNRLKFTRLIRDADKIDIYAVVIAGQRAYEANPKKFMLEIEYPLAGDCSPEVIEAVSRGVTVDYKLLKTMSDVRLLQIGWVYDINFAAALSRIKKRGYLDELALMLPHDTAVQAVVERIMRFVDERIARGD